METHLQPHLQNEQNHQAISLSTCVRIQSRLFRFTWPHIIVILAHPILLKIHNPSTAPTHGRNQQTKKFMKNHPLLSRAYCPKSLPLPPPPPFSSRIQSALFSARNRIARGPRHTGTYTLHLYIYIYRYVSLSALASGRLENPTNVKYNWTFTYPYKIFRIVSFPLVRERKERRPGEFSARWPVSNSRALAREEERTLQRRDEGERERGKGKFERAICRSRAGRCIIRGKGRARCAQCG